MEYLNVNELTKDNYYDALGSLNNHPTHINVDKMTITGFMSWEQKLSHYARLLAEVQS